MQQQERTTINCRWRYLGKFWSAWEQIWKLKEQLIVPPIFSFFSFHFLIITKDNFFLQVPFYFSLIDFFFLHNQISNKTLNKKNSITNLGLIITFGHKIDKACLVKFLFTTKVTFCAFWVTFSESFPSFS